MKPLAAGVWRLKQLPAPSVNVYRAENRRSIRKLAALNPSLIRPGHGPAVTDMAAFERFVTSLDG